MPLYDLCRLYTSAKGSSPPTEKAGLFHFHFDTPPCGYELVVKLIYRL